MGPEDYVSSLTTGKSQGAGCIRISTSIRSFGPIDELEPRNKVREKEGVRYVLEISDLSIQDAAQRLNGMNGVHDVSINDGVLQVHADVEMRMQNVKQTS